MYRTAGDGVDPLQRSLRPVVAVFLDVAFLGKGTESILVGLVDLLTFLLEVLECLRFLLFEPRGVLVHCLLGCGLEFCLLLRLHRIPDFRADSHDVVGDDVASEDKLRRHLVELHQLARHQRIVLAVDRTGLQRRV
ncbi:MAG: hypothetical protein WBL81_07485 [Pseudolabrys sp.]